MWTSRATLAVVLSVCFYLIGIINDLTSIYFLTSFVVSTTAICFLIALFSRSGVSIVCKLPSDPVCEGSDLLLRVLLSNAARVRKGPFLIRASIENETLNHKFARIFYVDPVAARESVELIARMDDLPRGAYRIDQITISGNDPIGLFRSRSRLSAHMNFTVFPRYWESMPRRNNWHSTKKGKEDQGESVSGSGIDFSGIRPFVDGDSLRYVHWSSTARLGRLAVRQFHSGDRPATLVVLDLRRCDRNPDLSETAIRAAATIACNRLGERDQVAAIVIAEEHRLVPFGSGAQQRLRILEMLARVRVPHRMSNSSLDRHEDDSDYSSVLRFLANRTNESSIVIVTVNHEFASFARWVRIQYSDVRILCLTESAPQADKKSHYDANVRVAHNEDEAKASLADLTASPLYSIHR